MIFIKEGKLESVFDKIIENFDIMNPKGWLKDGSFEEKIKYIRSFIINAFTILSKGKSSITTHPCKYSHPDEKEATPIIAKCSSFPDGYLRSGNVSNIKEDIYGNASYIPIYKFLHIELDDGKNIIKHIEEDTSQSRELLSLISDKSYEEIRNGFLATIKKANKYYTSSKIKQVYFPISNDDYHLLSVLMPSGIMSKLKEKIDDNFSLNKRENFYEMRKNNIYSDKIFVDYLDLSIVGFGGGHPKNISLICNEDRGQYYFLPSLPPTLDEDKIKTPARSFFNECLRYKYYTSEFKAWQKLLKAGPNNINIRKGRDKIIQYIFDDIIRRCFIVRTVEKGWSNQARCAELPEYEKILLDKKYDGQRNDAEDELKEFIKKAARWLIKAFESINGKEAVKMFDEELNYYKDLIEEQAEVLLC